MIKWEREHHQRKEEEKPTSYAGDAASMPIMREKNTALLVAMEGAGGCANIAGKSKK